MQVKVGETYYNSGVEPLMVIFEPHEAVEVADLDPDQLAYCCYPLGMDEATVLEWMKGVTEESEPIDETAG